MIEIEQDSPAMRELCAAFSFDGEIDEPRMLRIEQRADGVAIKVNEGMWSATLRTTKHAPVRLRCSLVGHTDHYEDKCRYGEQTTCNNCARVVECIDGLGVSWHDRGGNTTCYADYGTTKHTPYVDEPELNGPGWGS